jgi:sulfate adenylyltransferase
MRASFLTFFFLGFTLCQANEGTCTAKGHFSCNSGAGDPHGGVLVNTVVDAEAGKKLVAATTATIELSERQACDVVLMVNGGFSPLTGFMSKADYEGVVETMRTKEHGVLFGLPVVLDVNDNTLQGKKVLLKYKGTNIAVMEADEVWKPNKVKEAKASFGTTSVEHPSVQDLFSELGKYYVGGQVHGLVAGFSSVYEGKGFMTPAEVRATLPKGRPVVAFQNRNPVHKAHFELLVTANADVKDSILFVHPTVGPTQPGDITGAARIKTYEVLQQEPFYNAGVQPAGLGPRHCGRQP